VTAPTQGLHPRTFGPSKDRKRVLSKAFGPQTVALWALVNQCPGMKKSNSGHSR